jgi:hypothetical protein
MPRYLVTYTIPRLESCTVEVEAEDEDDACDHALDLLAEVPDHHYRRGPACDRGTFTARRLDEPADAAS